MLRTRTLVAAFAIAGSLLAACDDVATPMEPAGNPLADDALALVMEEASSRASDRHGDRGSLFDRLAAEIPSFGGAYRVRHCAVVVVLTDGADADHAIRVVKAAVEPLVERTCPGGIRVEVARGQFTYLELQRWLHAGQALLRIDGVYGITVSYQLNRLVVTVASREIVRRVLAVLPELGIPQEAVTFRGRLNHRWHDSTTGQRS